MRGTTNAAEFAIRYNAIRSKWEANNLKEFVAYFNQQWVLSEFHRWRAFDKLSGFSATNNPLDSFNKTIKQSYTNRKRLKLPEACSRLVKIVSMRSYDENNQFSFVAAATKAMVQKALKMDEEYSILIAESNTIVLERKDKENNTKRITLTRSPLTCSCRSFFLSFICKHLAFAKLKYSWNVSAKVKRCFVYRGNTPLTKKGRIATAKKALEKN